MRSPEDLKAAIAALESQRALLGDMVADMALAPLRAELAGLAPVDAPTPEQILKQVSVLFLDVVGSTTLSQHLDPEEVSIVMDGALARCTAIVQDHGGKVLQYAGDSLLAAFGAEEAQEDDAERAVRAGLALLEEGRLLGAEVQAAHGHAGFNLRLGIHTGSVLLGGGVDQDGTIRGITVNIAARMEQTAPAGALRISHDTYHQVRGSFDIEPQPPLQVKGVDAPITSYLVLRAKPRRFRLAARGVDQVITPLIGRDAEMACLTRALGQVIGERTSRALMLLAEAGLGKSRLLNELLHEVELRPEACWLFLGRCHPSSALEPYGLLRALLTWRLDIADSDSVEVAKRKLLDALVPLLGGADIETAKVDALCIGHLIGFDFSADAVLSGVLVQPARLRERALAALSRALQHLADTEGSPVVMLLEDLHWADDASLDWLQGFLSRLPAMPLLLVMSARPALLMRRTDWVGQFAVDDVVTLAPLDASHRVQLTAALLRRLPAPPADLLRLIDSRAEGNPFYAEELVKMLLDQGVIVDDAQAQGAWSLKPERLRLDQVPVTLTGVLQARLDTLTSNERHALQMASVIGTVFWDDALAMLAPHAPPAIGPLQAKAMVLTRPQSRFEDTAERAFHHHLLHQVTYDTVLKSARREGHARVAAWLQERAGDRSDEVLAITAEHFERAGDDERAFEWFARASQRARQRDAGLAALSYCQRALALPPPANARARIEVIVRQADTCDMLGRYDEMGRLLEQALAEIDASGADDLRLNVISSQVLLADRVGDIERGWALAQDLASAAERADNAARAALAWGNLAWISKARRKFDLAREQVARAMVWAVKHTARAPSDTESNLYEVQLLQVEAGIHDDAFDDDRCEQALQESLRRAEALRFVGRAKANAHAHLAQVALRRLDLENAALQLATAERIAGAIPVRRTLVICQLEQARLNQLSGRAELALSLAESAAQGFLQMGNVGDAGLARLVAVEVLRDAGRDAAMAETCRVAMAEFQEHGGLEGELCARLFLAQALQRLGQADDALALVRDAWGPIDRIGALGSGSHALAARWGACQVLQAHGDAGADRQLELTWTELERHVQRSRDPVIQARVRELSLHRDIAAAWKARQADATPPPRDPHP